MNALKLMLLLATLLSGCGLSINDRNAAWCVEDAALEEPARLAAAEWSRASDGEVQFSFYRASKCEAGTNQIRFESLGDHSGEMAATGELLVDPMFRVDPVSLQSILLHEFGHWLTGADHSSEPTDVMWGGWNDAVTLTDSDVARLGRTSRQVTANYVP